MNMNEPTIFTQIIRGEISCHKVYEDDKTLAFLDIHPVAKGHTLVISKAQVPTVWELENEDYEALMKTVQKVARRLKEVIAQPYVGEMVVGVDVPHAHVHVVPFSETHELKRTLETATAPTDHEALAKLAERLYFQ